MFEIYTTQGGSFRFRLKAKNGQNILASENYESKGAAENGVASVKKNAVSEDDFEKLVATDGQFYFNLKAGNGQVIGTSEMYTTTAARDNGIESVIKNAPGDVEDLC